MHRYKAIVPDGILLRWNNLSLLYFLLQYFIVHNMSAYLNIKRNAMSKYCEIVRVSYRLLRGWVIFLIRWYTCKLTDSVSIVCEMLTPIPWLSILWYNVQDGMGIFRLLCKYLLKLWTEHFVTALKCSDRHFTKQR